MDFYFLLHVSQMPPPGLLYLMQPREGCVGEIWLEQYLQSFPEVQGKATFDRLSEILGVRKVVYSHYLIGICQRVLTNIAETFSVCF